MEIKIGDIVDVTDGSWHMVLKEGVYKNSDEWEGLGWLQKNNPWEVIAVNQNLPTDVGKWSASSRNNDTMIRNVADKSIIACTQERFLKLHVDQKQEEIMKNKRDSLKKWEEGVQKISKLYAELALRCGYCKNHNDICEYCELYSNDICRNCSLIYSTTVFANVLTSLKKAKEKAEVMRDAIKNDIERG